MKKIFFIFFVLICAGCICKETPNLRIAVTSDAQAAVSENHWGIVNTEKIEDTPTSLAEYSGFMLYISASIETLVALGIEHTAVIKRTISSEKPVIFNIRHIARGITISFITER